MLTLGKKTDYALISLAYLASRSAVFISAREISESSHVPLPVVMQVLKALHTHGVLESSRGIKGGYRIGVDLDRLSLYDLNQMLATAELEPAPMAGTAMPAPVRHPPVEAMRQKLSQFLRDVRVSEVVSPGSRIDVPLSKVRVGLRLVEKIFASTAGASPVACSTNPGSAQCLEPVSV